jgi:4-amino-4-deoxy-L-arabinose transferase-like glycosyltransferase
LSLPFYWDEAWVYGPAIMTMVENGLSLLPDALPTELSRGHPLLLHFLGGIWGSIFGITMTSLHTFSLLFSFALLCLVYYIAKEIWSAKIGLLCSLGLALQPMFLAQSCLLLPEVPLAFFSIFALYAYWKKKWVLYFTMASAAILIKEPGIIIVCASGLHYIITCLQHKKGALKVFRELFLIASPIIPYIVFLIIQKAIHGWYFFPEHIGYIRSDWYKVYKKFDSYAAQLFIYQGRKVFLFSSLVLLILGVIKKVKIGFNQFQLLLAIYIVGFLAFSSLNFFSNRYIMATIAPFIMLSISSIHFIFKKNWVVIVGALIIIPWQIKSMRHHTNNDHNLGYVNAVKSQRDAVNYLVDNSLQNKHILAYFIGRESLTNPKSGYLDAKNTFDNVHKEMNDSVEYCLITNFDSDKTYVQLRERNDFQLMKRFEYKQAWAEIYKIDNP